MPLPDPSRLVLTASLPIEPDVVAPDGADIRVLLVTDKVSMAHGTLAVGQISLPVTHRTVSELWYVVGGSAEVWRKMGDDESTVTVGDGDALTIPLGAAFQYRTVGDTPFRFIMCTTPAWPGDDEAVPVPGRWEVS